MLPQASGWAILETVEGGLHERGDLEEKFVMQFSWHAPYEGWLQDYIVEIGRGCVWLIHSFSHVRST